MGDWKHDRLEHEIHQADQKNMAAAAAKKKLKEDAKWDEIKKALYVGDRTTDDSIDFVIDKLRLTHEVTLKKGK